MLLDFPMSDLSFSTEHRAPAPASVSSALGEGVSFSLVLNTHDAVVPNAAPIIAQVGQAKPIASALTLGTSEPVLRTELPGRILPQEEQILPNDGNPMPVLVAPEKSTPLPSILSHVGSEAQKPEEQPNELSPQEQSLAQLPEPLALQQIGTVEAAPNPVPHLASSTIVRFHVEGNPIEAQAAPRQIYTTETKNALGSPNAASPLPPLPNQSTPDNSPSAPAAKPVLDVNTPDEHSEMPPQRPMESPQAPSAASLASLPAEATRPTPRPSDLPVASHSLHDAPSWKKTEAPRSSTLGFEAEPVDVLDELAGKVRPNLQPTVTPPKMAKITDQPLVPLAAQPAPQTNIKAPAVPAVSAAPVVPEVPAASAAPVAPAAPAAYPSGYLMQKRERMMPIDGGREIGRELGDPQTTVSQPKQVLAEAAPKNSVQSPSLTPPKIAVDPNALALPVEKPSVGTVQQAPIPAPATSTMQTAAPLPMPAGMPTFDAFSGQSNTAAANTAANAAAANGAPQLRDAQPLERLVETISQMRESGQIGRGEVSLRHNQFGLVSMQVQSSEGELQARLASRDPGFVAAAQLVLAEKLVAERAFVATNDGGQTASRSNDGQQNNQNSQNQGRDMGAMAQNDGRQSGSASDDQKSGQASTKGEHDAALSSPDDHRPLKDVSTTQATNGIFA